MHQQDFVSPYKTKTLKTLLESSGTMCFVLLLSWNLVGSILPPSSCQHQNVFSRIPKLSRSKNIKNRNIKSLLFKRYTLCSYCVSWLDHLFFLFLLLLMSEHEMRRLVLMVDDVNLFTGRHHQCQTIILKRLISTKVLFMFL